MAEVSKIPTVVPEPAAGELPPFTLTVVMNMAGERQIHIASPVPSPISPDEANRRLDGLMKLAERQRSLIEIRILEEDIAAKTDALDKVWKVRKAEGEASLEEELAGVETKLAGILEKREKLKQAAYDDARATGRTGDVKLQGARLKDDNALKLAEQQAKDSVATKTAEHEQRVMLPILGNIEKLEAEIREMNRQLERHRAIVG